MDVTITLNEKLVKWYQKRADNFGLDLDDMVDFVLTAYAKKTDPKKACAIPNRARAAAGLSEEEAKQYVNFPLDKSLWCEAEKGAGKAGVDTTEFLTEKIRAFLAAEDG